MKQRGSYKAESTWVSLLLDLKGLIDYIIKSIVMYWQSPWLHYENSLVLQHSLVRKQSNAVPSAAVTWKCCGVSTRNCNDCGLKHSMKEPDLLFSLSYVLGRDMLKAYVALLWEDNTWANHRPYEGHSWSVTVVQHLPTANVKDLFVFLPQISWSSSSIIVSQKRQCMLITQERE